MGLDSGEKIVNKLNEERGPSISCPRCMTFVSRFKISVSLLLDPPPAITNVFPMIAQPWPPDLRISRSGQVSFGSQPLLDVGFPAARSRSNSRIPRPWLESVLEMMKNRVEETLTAQEWTNIMGRLGPRFQVVSPAGRKSLEVVVENPPNPPRTKTPTGRVTTAERHLSLVRSPTTELSHLPTASVDSLFQSMFRTKHCLEGSPQLLLALQPLVVVRPPQDTI